jgi:hypothetical protein
MFEYLLIVGITSAVEPSAAQKADQAFGHSQVEQVICDRPDMGPVINRAPALRALLESCFAGKFNGQRVYWDCREPVIGPRSEHIPPYLEYPDLVRVSSRPSISAIDKCTLLVLELQHGRSNTNLGALSDMVARKRISRNDFARSCVRLEFLGLQRTQEFFRKHPLAEIGSKINPEYNSIIATPNEFLDYLKQDEETNKKRSLLQYYLREYDRISSESTSNDLFNLDGQAGSHVGK